MRITFILPVFVADSTVDDFWLYGLCQVNQARALAALGHDVTVLIRFAQDATCDRDGVTYRFVKDHHGPTLRPWQSSAAILAALDKTAPQIVHYHGLRHPVFLSRITRAVAGSARIFAEYHGDGAVRFPLAGLQRRALGRLTGLIFANRERAERWRKIWRLPRDRIHHAVECAPQRDMTDRETARARTGFHGHPVLIWNSRAIARRNPDIVIESYERYLHDTPDAQCQFYMMVPDGDPELLTRIKALAVRSGPLRAHFTLMVGRKPQAAMTDYYNSADYIVSGSEDDPYGYGIADAMSCGVIPIVTGSATFLDITRGGTVGLMWDVTNPATLVEAFTRMTRDKSRIAQQARDVVALFNADLSMAAQGAALERIYLAGALCAQVSGVSPPHPPGT